MRTLKIYALIIIIIYMMIILYGCNAQPESSGKPTHFELNKGWQYRWGDSPLDSLGNPTWTSEGILGSNWKNTNRTLNLPGRNGSQFLWLRRKLPNVTLENPTIFFTNVFMAFDAYIENKNVYSAIDSHLLTKSKYSAARWHMFFLGDDVQGKTLYLRIYSDDSEHIGIPLLADNSALIGSYSGILNFIIRNSIDRFVLGCLFILIGIISTDLFFYRWEQKAYFYLSFGAFTTCIGLAFATSGEVAQFIISSTSFRFTAATIGLFLFPVGFFSFYEQLVAFKRKQVIRRIWQILLIYGLMLIIFHLTNVIRYNFLLHFIWTILLIAAFGYGIVCSIKGAVEGNVEAKLFNFGFMATILFVTHDLLFVFGVIPYWRWLSPWGVLIFILCLTNIIERKNSQDHKDLQKYSKELKEYSTKLEEKVDARTRDLKEKNTQLEDAMEKLWDTQEQLVMKEKMASLGHLVAGIAHEINNPISVVKSSADVSTRAIDKVTADFDKVCIAEDETEKKHINKTLNLIRNNNQVTLEASERIAKAVKSLKNFAQLDEAPYQENVDIHEGIDSTLTLLERNLDNRIKLVKDYGDIPQLDCYPSELNQVFMSVFLNATEAIEKEGLITVKTYCDDTNIHIQFSDTGKGIQPDDLDQIFNPGFTTKGSGVGIGLGLSTVYNIIQKHHGDIDVQSTVGKGTSILISLPMEQG